LTIELTPRSDPPLGFTLPEPSMHISASCTSRGTIPSVHVIILKTLNLATPSHHQRWSGNRSALYAIYPMQFVVKHPMHRCCAVQHPQVLKQSPKKSVRSPLKTQRLPIHGSREGP
jgi:hypothetical protein